MIGSFVENIIKNAFIVQTFWYFIDSQLAHGMLHLSKIDHLLSMASDMMRVRRSQRPDSLFRWQSRRHDQENGHQLPGPLPWTETNRWRPPWRQPLLPDFHWPRRIAITMAKCQTHHKGFVVNRLKLAKPKRPSPKGDTDCQQHHGWIYGCIGKNIIVSDYMIYNSFIVCQFSCKQPRIWRAWKTWWRSKISLARADRLLAPDFHNHMMIRQKIFPMIYARGSNHSCGRSNRGQW